MRHILFVHLKVLNLESCLNFIFKAKIRKEKVTNICIHLNALLGSHWSIDVELKAQILLD